MKKIALATLLAATTLVATAQVSVSGKISEFADNTKTGATSKTTLVTDPTSNFTFSANENIGSGLKARVVLDTSLAANDPTGGSATKLGDRQSTVGLANRLGSIDLGRNLHSHFLAVTNNDAFGTLYGSIAGQAANYHCTAGIQRGTEYVGVADQFIHSGSSATLYGSIAADASKCGCTAAGYGICADHCVDSEATYLCCPSAVKCTSSDIGIAD